MRAGPRFIGPVALLFLAAAQVVLAGPAPTYCLEWIRQWPDGFERFTVFADGAMVWKTSRQGEQPEVNRKSLIPAERDFYCAYFAREQFWSVPEDLRTGLKGTFAQSLLKLARPDGSVKSISFDEFSPLSADAATLRAAMEGLKGIFLSPLAPASRFTPDSLPAGIVLKRFDGRFFRVRHLEAGKGIVELEGIHEPYTEFRKIEELRFLFSPPE